MRNYYKKLKKGFTLVELVVVIAVIAILAAVSVGAYFGITDSANSSNATTSLKQVKDYWTMYSVSDYDASKTDYETGNDFAARYITYQGYDVAVNFKTVNYTRNTGAQGLAGYDNGNGILFKVETNYPTWILVEDNRIIAESKAPLKNNEEFMASLEEGEYVITTLANWNDFELTTLKSGDTEVRGVGYVKYVVTSNKNNNVETKTYYVNATKSLAEEYDNFLPDGYTGLVTKDTLQIQSEEVWKIYEVKGSERKEFNTTVVPENIGNTIVETIPEERGLINGQVLKIINLDQQYANLDEKEFNIDDYPVIVKIGNSYIAYKSLDELNGKYVDKDGVQHDKLPAATHTADKYRTYNYIFCYGNKAKLSSTLTIPTGYILAIDYNTFEDVTTIEDFVNTYIDGVNATSKVNESTVVNNTFYDLGETDYVTYWQASEASKRPADVTTDSVYGLNAKYAIEKNRLSIEGSLTFAEDAHLFNEALFVIPDGTWSGCGITSHGAIYMDDDASINLSKTSIIRTLGKIYGGTINTTGDNTNGTVIYDLFKPYSFLGGSFTSLHIGSTIFPVYNYIFDNIQSSVVMNAGARYKLICGLSVSTGKTFMAPIELIGANNSGFLIIGNNSSLTIGYSEGKIDINLTKGTFALGEINLTLYGQNIKSSDYRFPLNNIYLTVSANSTLNVSKYEYLVMPTAKIINYGTINATSNTKITVFNFDESSLNTLLSSLKFANTDIGKHLYNRCSRTKLFNEVLYETFRNYLNYVDNKIVYNFNTATVDSTSGIYSINEIENSATAVLDNGSTAAATTEYMYMFKIEHSSTLCDLGSAIGFNDDAAEKHTYTINRYTKSFNV